MTAAQGSKLKLIEMSIRRQRFDMLTAAADSCSSLGNGNADVDGAVAAAGRDEEVTVCGPHCVYVTFAVNS